MRMSEIHKDNEDKMTIKQSKVFIDDYDRLCLNVSLIRNMEAGIYQLDLPKIIIPTDVIEDTTEPVWNGKQYLTSFGQCVMRSGEDSFCVELAPIEDPDMGKPIFFKVTKLFDKIPTDMTLDEIEKALGKKIRIVSEKEGSKNEKNNR